MPTKNAFYAQSGGVTAVINASAAGVIETARQHPDRIGTLYAGKNGILGALREQLYDTSVETDQAIHALLHTPGGAFGSCRYKLKNFEVERREYERLLEVFAAYDIQYFFYNGGNDSADTCLKVSRIAEHLGYPLQAIQVPKTVDNDLPITDNCPGFGSAAKYVAVSSLEAKMDVQSMAETSTKVFIIEVMGRHAGWLAAAGGMADPDLILFPEIAFDRAGFLARVKACVDQRGFCVIVASEGARDAAGRLLAESGSVDAFGHQQLGGVAPTLARLIKEQLGYKYHWAVADYLQRSARHLASATDLDQAYAVGRAAVEYALAGKNAVMPAIRRLSDAPYRWDLIEAPLTQVANIEKKLPREFIDAEGYGITTAARAYLEPLISGEAATPWSRGMPVHTRLQLQLVEPRLAPWSG